MRKRLVCVMVSVLMLISALSALAGEADKTKTSHLLWGIPFGSTREECMRIAKEEHGIILKEQTEALLSTTGQDVSIMGYSALITFSFAEDADYLHSITIRFLGDIYNHYGMDALVRNEACLAAFSQVYEKVDGNFAPATGGYLAVSLKNEETESTAPYSDFPAENGDINYYNYPRENDSLHYDTLRKLIDPPYYGFSIMSYYDNVRVEYFFTRYNAINTLMMRLAVTIRLIDTSSREYTRDPYSFVAEQGFFTPLSIEVGF